MIQSVFYFLAFVAIFFAAMVVISRNPIYSVLYLILTFFAIGANYLLLNAQFLFVVHLIVYAGAIMVLFMFVIMLLNLNAETEPIKSNLLKFAAVISGGLLMIVMIAALRGTDTIISNGGQNSQIGMIKVLGKVLFTDYILPFEIASILFLIAMIGAVILGKKDPKIVIESSYTINKNA